MCARQRSLPDCEAVVEFTGSHRVVSATTDHYVRSSIGNVVCYRGTKRQDFRLDQSAAQRRN
jgi:hypothetical protein